VGAGDGAPLLLLAPPLHPQHSLELHHLSASSLLPQSPTAAAAAAAAAAHAPPPPPGGDDDGAGDRDNVCYICVDSGDAAGEPPAATDAAAAAEPDAPPGESATALVPSQCACRKLVHRSCLKRWIATRGSRLCSICKAKLPVDFTCDPPYVTLQVVRHMRGLHWAGEREYVANFAPGSGHSDGVTLGSWHDCALVLPDPSLSRLHARLHFVRTPVPAAAAAAAAPADAVVTSAGVAWLLRSRARYGSSCSRFVALLSSDEQFAHVDHISRQILARLAPADAGPARAKLDADRKDAALAALQARLDKSEAQVKAAAADTDKQLASHKAAAAA
jgi:hypothetical protein